MSEGRYAVIKIFALTMMRRLPLLRARVIAAAAAAGDGGGGGTLGMPRPRNTGPWTNFEHLAACASSVVALSLRRNK
jgi:hypothetical protein